jgi:CheY-like chemotaxis protein/c-di-GMP-binding flagellar brake protein YcgR
MLARSPTPSVLIADAEFYICRVLEAKLSKDNRFRVVTATTGLAALQVALDQSFDVIMWDMRLRDTSDLLPRLRALCPRAALFLMTTDDRPMLDADILRLDVAGILVKPFSLETLVDQLEQALKQMSATSAAAVIDLARVGQLLTLVSPGGRCVTRVLDRNLDTFTVLGAPRVETPADFATGLRLRVQVKGDDALYSFNSRLLRFLSHPIPRWELRLPSVIRREQRRKYPRVPMRIPVVLTNRLPGEMASAGRPPAPRAEALEPFAITGLTEDLSMGGCALLSAQPLPLGTPVRFDLQHTALHGLEGEGTVVRIQPLVSAETPPEESASRFRLAVQFTAVEAGVRRRLRSLFGPNG